MVTTADGTLQFATACYLAQPKHCYLGELEKLLICNEVSEFEEELSLLGAERYPLPRLGGTPELTEWIATVRREQKMWRKSSNEGLVMSLIEFLRALDADWPRYAECKGAIQQALRDIQHLQAVNGLENASLCCRWTDLASLEFHEAVNRHAVVFRSFVPCLPEPLSDMKPEILSILGTLFTLPNLPPLIFLGCSSTSYGLSKLRQTLCQQKHNTADTWELFYDLVDKLWSHDERGISASLRSNFQISFGSEQYTLPQVRLRSLPALARQELGVMLILENIFSSNIVAIIEKIYNFPQPAVDLVATLKKVAESLDPASLRPTPEQHEFFKALDRIPAATLQPLLQTKSLELAKAFDVFHEMKRLQKTPNATPRKNLRKSPAFFVCNGGQYGYAKAAVLLPPYLANYPTISFSLPIYDIRTLMNDCLETNTLHVNTAATLVYRQQLHNLLLNEAKNLLEVEREACQDLCKTLVVGYVEHSQFVRKLQTRTFRLHCRLQADKRKSLYTFSRQTSEAACRLDWNQPKRFIVFGSSSAIRFDLDLLVNLLPLSLDRVNQMRSWQTSVTLPPERWGEVLPDIGLPPYVPESASEEASGGGKGRGDGKRLGAPKPGLGTHGTGTEPGASVTGGEVQEGRGVSNRQPNINVREDMPEVAFAQRLNALLMEETGSDLADKLRVFLANYQPVGGPKLANPALQKVLLLTLCPLLTAC